jgi:hypothetical protein
MAGPGASRATIWLSVLPKRPLDAFAPRNQRIRTDRTFELGVSPLVRGASLLMLLSSVACGAINVDCSSDMQ